MTTRPYLLAFAACVAGLVATAPVVLVLTFDSTPDLRILLWLFSALPVFAGVAGSVMHLENEQAVAQKRADLQQQRVSTAEREWNLKAAKLQAAVASGLAGAREVEADERAWVLALEILFRAGDAAGSFSGAALAGCVGSDTHPALMDFYTSPAGLAILRNVGGNKGHRWGFKPDGTLWALDDVLGLLRAGKLPHPEGKVPDIRRPPDSAALRKAARKSNKAVEGVAPEVVR